MITVINNVQRSSKLTNICNKIFTLISKNITKIRSGNWPDTKPFKSICVPQQATKALTSSYTIVFAVVSFLTFPYFPLWREQNQV